MDLVFFILIQFSSKYYGVDLKLFKIAVIAWINIFYIFVYRIFKVKLHKRLLFWRGLSWHWQPESCTTAAQLLVKVVKWPFSLLHVCCV